jgi:hypothetical protein
MGLGSACSISISIVRVDQLAVLPSRSRFLGRPPHVRNRWRALDDGGGERTASASSGTARWAASSTSSRPRRRRARRRCPAHGGTPSPACTRSRWRSRTRMRTPPRPTYGSNAAAATATATSTTSPRRDAPLRQRRHRRPLGAPPPLYAPPPLLRALHVVLDWYGQEDATAVDHWVSYALSHAAPPPAGIELDLRFNRAGLRGRRE